MITNAQRNQAEAISNELKKLVGNDLAVKHWYGKPRETFLRMVDSKPRPTAKAVAEAMAAEIRVLEKS